MECLRTGGAVGVGGEVAAVEPVVQLRLDGFRGHVVVHLRRAAGDDVEACSAHTPG